MIVICENLFSIDKKYSFDISFKLILKNISDIGNICFPIFIPC